MAAFKLPRLKANLAIVDARGKPLDYFLRLFNIDLAQRIEQNETQQNEILERLLAAELAAQQAQETAEAAQIAADGAATGAAKDARPVNGIISSSSFSTLASVSYPSRQADGWWDLTFLASVSSDGVGSNTLEFRLIEQGQPTALATGTSEPISGDTPSPLSVIFSPTAPYKQTAPAGNITLLFQARRATGTSSITVNGFLVTSYTPSPT